MQFGKADNDARDAPHFAHGLIGPADKEFCSSHRLSLRYGAQCASHIRLTLHVSQVAHLPYASRLPIA